MSELQLETAQQGFLKVKKDKKKRTFLGYAMCDAQNHKPRKVHMESNTGNVYDIGSLYARLLKLRDNRKAKGKRYALATLLLIIFLAKLCGEDRPSGIAEWAKHRSAWIVGMLGLKRKEMANHNTYRRILAHGVNVEEMERLAREHFKQCGKTGYDVVISLDGKIMRGTREGESREGLCLLAVYLPGESVTLAQVALEKGQSEITAAPVVLESVDLRNKVVIGDALHTQRQVSIQIGKAGGNYLWTVKGNQPQLLEDIRGWFDDKVTLIPGMGDPPKDFSAATKVNKGHGRLEVRTLTTSSQLNDFLDWPFLKQVFKLDRTITTLKTGQTRHEVVYGITSLTAEQAPPCKLLGMLRSYWHIENGLHYRRDVTFQEDRTRFKYNSAAHAMATINNILLGLLALSASPFLPSLRRFFAAYPDHALHLLTRL
jgi:predicted transposase YbfD/YdcC